MSPKESKKVEIELAELDEQFIEIKTFHHRYLIVSGVLELSVVRGKTIRLTLIDEKKDRHRAALLAHLASWLEICFLFCQLIFSLLKR